MLHYRTTKRQYPSCHLTALSLLSCVIFVISPAKTLIYIFYSFSSDMASVMSILQGKMTATRKYYTKRIRVKTRHLLHSFKLLQNCSEHRFAVSNKTILQGPMKRDSNTSRKQTRCLQYVQFKEGQCEGSNIGKVFVLNAKPIYHQNPQVFQHCA